MILCKLIKINRWIGIYTFGLNLNTNVTESLALAHIIHLLWALWSVALQHRIPALEGQLLGVVICWWHLERADRRSGQAGGGRRRHRHDDDTDEDRSSRLHSSHLPEQVQLYCARIVLDCRALRVRGCHSGFVTWSLRVRCRPTDW